MIINIPQRRLLIKDIWYMHSLFSPCNSTVLYPYILYLRIFLASNKDTGL